ncbi:MAG TPA: hypothetical protein VH986_15160 [Acidimicrobiia bacterium]|jgi:hypothetical protein
MQKAAREWVSFDDPEEDGRRWQIDITFLLSRWQCVFGNGCQGVLTEKAPELIHGCCSYGAHFSDKADRRAVERLARKLGDDEWQYAKRGRKKGIAVKVGKDEDGTPDYRTRLVKGACVFLNRPGFPTGPGCALHQHAMRVGEHHSDWKPEVCWQLPLRRVDEEQEDGSVISTLTEFGREGWGEGGEDFAWWCTEAPEAFTAPDPVYRSLDVELRKMLGKKLHRSVVAYLDARAAARDLPAVVHPAEIPIALGKKPKHKR